MKKHSTQNRSMILFDTKPEFCFVNSFTPVKTKIASLSPDIVHRQTSGSRRSHCKKKKKKLAQNN